MIRTPEIRKNNDICVHIPEYSDRIKGRDSSKEKCRNNPIDNSSITMTSSPELIRIPDLFALSPFKYQGISPHYSNLAGTSLKWILSHGDLDIPTQQKISIANCELFGASTYPFANRDIVSIASDTTAIIITLDEIVDVSDSKGIESFQETVMNAIIGKAPEDCSFLAKLMRGYAGRIQYLTQDSVSICERINNSVQLYVDSFGPEINRREGGELLSIEDYIVHRRENSTLRFYYIFVEIALGCNFPSELLSDLDFINANYFAIDLSAIGNDVYSFAVEYYRDIEDNNIVSAFMNEKNCSVQEAMDFVKSHYEDTLDKFLASRDRIKSYGPDVDKEVKNYMDALEQVIWGVFEWTATSARYNEKGPTMKQTHTITLKKQKEL